MMRRGCLRYLLCLVYACVCLGTFLAFQDFLSVDKTTKSVEYNTHLSVTVIGGIHTTGAGDYFFCSNIFY